MRIHTILQDMLAAYDNGEADEQRSEFIAGWALTIDPPADAKKAAALEVVVHGNPVDGFTIVGPYPVGHWEDRAVPEEAWVVTLGRP